METSIQDSTIQRGFRACHCTLPPECCKNCPNNSTGINEYNPYDQSPTIPEREIIEEFDEQGRLIRKTIYERGHKFFTFPYPSETIPITEIQSFNLDGIKVLKINTTDDIQPQDNKIRN